MENEENTYSNSALRQQIDQYFVPAESWENCQMPLLKEEMWEQVHELLPGFFKSIKNCSRSC